MKCKNCYTNDGIMYSKYTSGEFCSRKCSRAYSTKPKRSEINDKVSAALKGRKVGGRFKKGYDPTRFIGFSTPEHQEKATLARKKRFDEYIKSTPFELLSKNVRKRILIEERGCKCEWCNNSTWLGKKIVLALDHIDGNHQNNLKENQRLLCPNCHSLTPTWCNRHA